jgi:hypothetical protein
MGERLAKLVQSCALVFVFLVFGTSKPPEKRLAGSAGGFGLAGR